MATRNELLTSAARKLEAYLATGLAGFFSQAWDRMNAAGLDVDLRREATRQNAEALLWTAKNQLEMATLV